MSEKSRPLRVWLACDWFVKYVVGLAEGLTEVGCEVTLLTRDHDQEFGGEPGAMRSFVSARLDGRVRHLELGGRVSDPRAIGAVLTTRRACRRWGPDVVHVQDSLANDFRLALASGLPPRSYALTVHDPVPHPGDATPPLTTRLSRRVLRRAAGLVFVHSEELRAELTATGGTRAPIEVVPHGVGAAAPAPLPARKSLLFFGRISHYKGLDVLLDAMPRIWQAHPEMTLTVAGEGEGGAPDHSLLSDPRVAYRAEHVPEESIPALFAAATCVVLPYRQASQSGVGSLAREHGRAVVATRVGGLPELVTPDWGRLVAPEDPEALAEAILEVVDTPGLAEEMGRAAAGSGDQLDWGSVAAKTVAAYRAHLL
ncbi:MAG: glycosyltransferase family 4 protein [Solirubrobacterales bacterium]